MQQENFFDRLNLAPATQRFIAKGEKRQRERGIPFNVDTFETDRRIIWAALNEVWLNDSIDRRRKIVLDAGSGDGRWLDQAAKNWPNSRRIGVELRNLPQPASAHVWVPRQDFLTYAPEHPDLRPDLVVMNPPFSLAEEFIRHAWAISSDHGAIVAFTRLELLAGQTRGKSFWPSHPADRVYVLTERPSFTNDGVTDNTEYMVCTWKKANTGYPTSQYRIWWKDPAMVARPEYPHASYEWA